MSDKTTVGTGSVQKNNVRLHYALATDKQNKQQAVPSSKGLKGTVNAK